MALKKRVSARELLNEMKKYKSLDDKVTCQDGKILTAQDYFAPIMAEYARNYDDYELRKLARYDASSLDSAELHVRLRHIRFLLAQPIASVSNYACITLSVAGFNFAYIYVVLGDPPMVAYISLGDSMKSYDGEWRGMMTNMASYEYIIKNYAGTVDSILKSAKFKQSPKIHIYFNTSLLSSAVDSIEALIKDSHLSENLMALAWFIGKYVDSPSPEFAKFCKLGGALGANNFDQAEGDAIYQILGSFFDVRTSQSGVSVVDRSVRVGQKLIQLTPDETSHPLNGSYQAWNEILVAKETLDLVMNMVCPGFAIHSFWLMLFETSKFMYNTKDTRSRIAQSQTIRLTPNDKRTSKILSSQALCMVNEYCGPTWRHSLLNKELSAKVIKNGSKYVFEFIYALFCLHSRLGQFHGDFHCDNATIMQLVESDEKQDRKIGYVIGADKFVFPHDGSYGCVIDFSRTIHMDNPMWVERVIEKYELYFGKDILVQNSSGGISLYDALDDANFLEKLKKNASAFDIYEFAHTSLIQCASVLVETELGVLLEAIKTESREILMCVLKSSGDSSSWAAHIILKKYWPEAVMSEFKSNDVFRGIYTYDNPLQFSARSYETLPRSISHGPIIRDSDDEVVDLYLDPSLTIKTRYKLWKEDQIGLIGADMKKSI